MIMKFIIDRIEADLYLHKNILSQFIVFNENNLFNNAAYWKKSKGELDMVIKRSCAQL